jgi:hypothetical protein
MRTLVATMARSSYTVLRHRSYRQHGPYFRTSAPYQATLCDLPNCQMHPTFHMIKYPNHTREFALCQEEAPSDCYPQDPSLWRRLRNTRRLPPSF